MLLAKEGDRLLIFDLQVHEELRVGEPSVLRTSGWGSTPLRILRRALGIRCAFLLGTEHRAGALHLFPVQYGTDQLWDLGTPTTVASSGWGARQRPQMAVVGDMDGDGSSDVVTSDRSGALWLHPAAEDGTPGTPVALHASRWRGVTFF
ncbi:hypothetical protein ACIHCQ_44430 [Streptomyces sp. NPDC052236]|uniref:hypothetical protein n=1 Tax=Streptomyces sp. NPDC052236 TaxID=3365686 RepID=UPI0037D7140E